jgi:hypothetical protein
MCMVFPLSRVNPYFVTVAREIALRNKIPAIRLPRPPALIKTIGSATNRRVFRLSLQLVTQSQTLATGLKVISTWDTFCDPN